ncbi:hypothetical protein KBX73_07280 [Acetobacter persici]|uniref:hypothetical protein n=1 Tax=Acetobacter persici TaxID=1076596 RepID=UPI0020CF9E5B|nr:hypothetical protein [Acetobacter persici]MCP9319575.1 hypothetical protein [Acetobacter persici]
MLEEAESPELVMQECLDLLKQISEQRLRIDDKTKEISILAQESAKGLQIAEHAWSWSYDSVDFHRELGSSALFVMMFFDYAG